MRDDLDAPYAGAASAVCGTCGQPKGRGYGCAVLPADAPADGPYVTHERDYRWSQIEGFTEQCPGCEATDATHYHVPPVLDSGDSGAVAVSDAPNAITLAIEVLEHVNQWATLDPEGQQYRWIAVRTAEALEAARAGLEAERWSADRNCLEWAEKLDAAQHEAAAMRPVVVAACAWRRDITTGVLTVPQHLEADGNLSDVVADYQEAAEREGGGTE